MVMVTVWSCGYSLAGGNGDLSCRVFLVSLLPVLETAGIDFGVVDRYGQLALFVPAFRENGLFQVLHMILPLTWALAFNYAFLPAQRLRK